MVRKYTGNSDGVSATGALGGTVRFVELCQARWKFTNLGVFSNRRMNNASAAADPTNPKWLSVHATGRACDIGDKKRKDAIEAWLWFLEHAAVLGIEEMHDYAFDPDGVGGKKAWGRGFRCSRGEGNKGVRIFDDSNNAGSAGGQWLHVELSPALAADGDRLEAIWRGLPKP